MTKRGFGRGFGISIALLGTFSSPGWSSSYTSENIAEIVREHALVKRYVSPRGTDSMPPSFPDNRFYPANMLTWLEDLKNGRTDESDNLYISPSSTPKLPSLTPKDIPITQGRATSKISIKLNFPSQDPVGKIYKTSISIVNPWFNKTTLAITWTKISKSPLTWRGAFTAFDIPVRALTRAQTGTPYNDDSPFTVLFDENGSPASFDDGKSLEDLKIDWGTLRASQLPTCIALDFGTIGSPTGLTSVGKLFFAPTVQQNGHELGTLVDVIPDGQESRRAFYTNGMRDSFPPSTLGSSHSQEEDHDTP